MNEPEFQLCNPLQLLARGLNLGRAQTRNLDKDMIGSLFGDHRFTDAEFVNPLANRFYRLLLHFGRNWTRFATIFRNRRNKPDEKGCAPLQVEAEMNLFLE